MAADLTGVHPDLVERVCTVLAAMRILGFQMMITDAVRTDEKQAALYAQGRTAPGKIVTNADGVLKRSNHQPHADGYGHAVDCCFVVNGQPSWDLHLPWTVYGEAAKALGLKWGGDWASIRDWPHVELP